MHRTRWWKGRTWVWAVIGGSALAGCEAMESLRALFHPETPAAGASAAQEEAPPPSSPELSGLRVEVVPSEGITLLLDGEPVANQSPYENLELPPGAHRLMVRAMGHHIFEIPLMLAPGKTLTLPIWLRPRHEAPPRRRDRQ